MSANVSIPKRTIAQRYHLKVLLAVVFLTVIFVESSNLTGVNITLFFDNFSQFTVLLNQMAHPSWAYLSVVLTPLYETIKMAIIGTTVGTLVAIPFSFVAAHNLCKKPIIRHIVRLILDLVRTLPDLLLAALFVAIFGIGTSAGIITLAIFSFGMVSKLFYEVIETIDMGPVEALKSAGANPIQVIFFAVIPQIINSLLSYFLYTLEINVRASTVLGYVGAGGIGVFLQRSLDQFNYGDTAVIIIATILVVLIIDFISNHLRRKLQ